MFVVKDCLFGFKFHAVILFASIYISLVKSQVDLTFSAIASTTKTDKITKHRYQLIYDEFFDKDSRKNSKKILEIGLGCNMEYGPGASAHIWPRLFPNASIYFVEYDGNCVKKYQSELDELGITVFVGDQADKSFLRRVAMAGPYDIIIDDGGHSDRQMLNSLRILSDALSPGGIYFIEDMVCNFEPLAAPGSSYADYAGSDAESDWGHIGHHNNVTHLGSVQRKGAPITIIQRFVMELSASYLSGKTWARDRFKYVGCGPGICFFKTFTNHERQILR